MARLIVKSPYFKGGSAKPAGGYLRYIATRERVEILPDDRPPTKRQTQLIEKLTKDFPDTKTLLEYGDYAAHPTKFNASQFLTLAMEENWGKVQEIDGYAKYIATRPRAERMGGHGLFGDEDAVDLTAAMAEVNSYTGNIWTHIISLRREDAERLGFDHADAWRALLRAHRNDIAEAMRIPPEDFRWYAAFHDEGGHPHVHMMAWSKKPGQAYLNRDGIRKIKSALTNQIFQQELLHIYENKSQSRDELVRETRSAMLALAQKMQAEITNVQEEIENETFTATTGGGAVEITMNGRKQVQSLNIKPEVVDKDDVEMLQDLLISAINECVKQIEDTSEAKMGAVTGGVSFPGLF